jgi:hypothetical protein
MTSSPSLFPTFFSLLSPSFKPFLIREAAQDIRPKNRGLHETAFAPPHLQFSSIMPVMASDKPSLRSLLHRRCGFIDQGDRRLVRLDMVCELRHGME